MFLVRKSCRLWDNVEKNSTDGQITDDNVAHTHCRLNTRGYKHTLRICNTSCFTTTAVVKWTQFNVTFYVLCRYSVIWRYSISQKKGKLTVMCFLVSIPHASGSASLQFEVYVPVEFWNKLKCQLNATNFISVFLARHVSGAYAHHQ